MFDRHPADRRILALAVPALGTLAAEPLFRLVDTAVLGRVGTVELGGVAVAVTVLALVTAGSNFLAYGTTERVARRAGAGDQAGAGDVGVNAVWLAILIGLSAAVVLFVFARPLCALIGGDDDVLRHAVTYLRISAIGIPFVVVGLATQGVMRGVADYRTPLRVLVAANCFNAIVEVIVVLGFDTGVAGAAWTTVAAQAGAGIALLRASRRQLANAYDGRASWVEMRALLVVGRHLVLRVGAMLAVFTGASSIAARTDTPTLAAHQIAMTMFLFLALTLDALAVPAQTLVAEALGRQEGDAAADGTQAADADTDRFPVADVVRRVTILSVRIAAVIAALLATTSPLVARVFSDNDAVVSRATVALVLLAVALLPGGVAFAYDGVLIGAGDYRFLGWAAVAGLVAVLPLAVIVTSTSLGIAGLWGGLVAWMTLRAAINHVRQRRVVAGFAPGV